MDQRTHITRLLLNNASCPFLIVKWVEDGDGKGWTGNAVVWDNENEKRVGWNHNVEIRQTTPLGYIAVYLDSCKGGSWRYHTFEGTGITERDLQWATAWAALAIESKHVNR